MTQQAPDTRRVPAPPPQLESYIQTGMRPEMAELRQTAVQNQTAAMLEMGSSLLNRSAEQSRKLTDVEAQVRASPCPHRPWERGGQTLVCGGAGVVCRDAR